VSDNPDNGFFILRRRGVLDYFWESCLLAMTFDPTFGSFPTGFFGESV
jgi:hypothetical protein